MKIEKLNSKNGEELDENLDILLNHLESIKQSLPMAQYLLIPYHKAAIVKYNDFLNSRTVRVEGEDDPYVEIKPEESELYERLQRNAQHSNMVVSILPESLFVSLISQYDAFLNRFLRALFRIVPEYINSSERSLSFAQLSAFKSIEEAREYTIEREVETVLRKSHSEHFDYLESKVGIKLRNNLSIWNTFIEITERRNLFVHCDGLVSNQYLKVCSDNSVDVKGVKLNERLNVDLNYFFGAHECLYELAVKLTHTIWRKLMISDLENADKKLNQICYNLIKNKEFKLSDKLLDFSCLQIRHYNATYKNMFIVNKALSLFLQGKEEKAGDIINSQDWSASSNEFKLAHLVLTRQFEECYSLMKVIGKDGSIEKLEYKSWPLFWIIRNEEEFITTYFEIFQEDYSLLEVPNVLLGEMFVTERARRKEKSSSHRSNEENFQTQIETDSKNSVDEDHSNSLSENLNES